jgi:hypothetical protein
MNRPRLILWLRIAVSAVCLVVCVGLSWLWVRSYSYLDFCQMNVTQANRLHIQAVNERLMLFILHFNRGLEIGYFPKNLVEPLRYEQAITGKVIPGGVNYWMWSPLGSGIRLPFWILGPASAALAFIPWLPWHKIPLPTRFSLRSLLIVTTLVAVVLGLAMWSIR